jgi:hypothetical protein
VLLRMKHSFGVLSLLEAVIWFPLVEKLSVFISFY